MKCPHCGTDNADWLSKCNACGKSLDDTAQSRHCVSCGRSIGFDINVCPYCGHDYRMPVAPQVPREEVSTGMRILLYIVSFLIPLVGFIIGVIFYMKADPQPKHVGKMCIIAGVLGILLTVVMAAVLYVLVLGFGVPSAVTPTAVYADQAAIGGRRVTILAIQASNPVPWNDVTIQLTDGSYYASWEPAKSDLDTGPGVMYDYGTEMCGSMAVSCSVVDLGGDGYVSGSDYFVLYATYDDGAEYQSWLLYEDTASKIGTGASWIG